MKLIIAVLLAVVLWSGSLSAQTTDLVGEPRAWKPCQVIGVVDADTFDCAIDLGFGLHLAGRIRVLEYDAPETRRIERGGVRVTEDEVIRGLTARRVASNILIGKVWIEDGGRDVYGRVLAHVMAFIDGRWIDYAVHMRSEGHVR